jgi:very-short-patch-repair endonuclease
VLARYEEERTRYETQLVVWERVRELVQKVALEPYAKEIVYAAPLLAGYLPKHGGRVEPVLAPLFTQAVTAETQHDGSIVITAQDESLRFNTALWQDATSSHNIGQIQSRGIDAQADLAGGWDPARVEELLRAIAAVLPFATADAPEGALAPWPERGTPTSYRSAEPALDLHEGAALFISNKSSHYLLHDLEEIQADPSPFLDGLGERPLSILLSDPSNEDRPPSAWLTEDQVGFPFPSNPAQRQVADALEKNAVVVVQGPPGTGKSLTIANLVAHLVAQGKSVLVTSHKQQALTVVRDKLNEMDLDFLYASLIGDTGQAKRELQSQIANVRAFAGMANATRLKKQLSDIEKRRSENGARYATARDEFLKRAEPEQIEAAGLYPRFEPHPLLPVSDPAVDEPEIPEVAEGLRFLDEKAREHGEIWGELLRSELASSDQIEIVAPLLRHFLDHQHARVRAATDQRIAALVAQWHPILDADPNQIRKTRAAIGAVEESLIDSLGSVLAAPDPVAERNAALLLATTPELLEDARGAAEQLRLLFDDARQLSDARTAVSAQPVRRAEVGLHHMELGSLMRRRGAKKWLDEHAPGAAGLSADLVGRWASFWTCWAAVQTHASGLGGGLREAIPDDYDPDAVARFVARLNRVIALADGVRAADKATRATRVSLPIEDVRDAIALDDAKGAINRWVTAVSAAEADQEGNKLIASDDLVLIRGALAKLDDLLDQGQADAAAEPFTRLESVWHTLPSLGERRDLLREVCGKFKGAVGEIETAAVKGAERPPFLNDVEQALRLQPTVKRFAKIATDRSTRDISVELRELHRQLLEDARRLLGLRIQSRILAGFRKPRFLASLEAFKKAVGTSAKRHERFEELKTSTTFDIDILTDVFPCWIMRPEDACRIFPLREGIFDVLIFDEASQCNSDQALPLFARAEKVAIFGDQKQLTNEDLRRSLSAAANKALLRAAELEPLDPSGLFDQTQNSLLDLVSHRQQAAVLLNEHFRCRPEIVAFSNGRFYGGDLRVIRDRADDRGLGPALVVRQVLNPIDGGVSKVNYAEARALVDELANRLTDRRYAEMTFGVLSLFREQIEHIQSLVEREIDRDLLERHRVICSTVDGFQGDERDVILYSWRFAKGASPAIFAFTNGEGGSQRVNVALTRARHQAIHFVSGSIQRFPVGAGNVTPYLKHSLDPDRLLAQMEQRAHRTPGGEARRRVAKALRDAGFEVQEDFVACGVSIDLVAVADTGARAAVFVDAEANPHPETAALERVDSHGLLERAGWRVVRVPATEALPSPQKAVGLVAEATAGVEAAPRVETDDPVYATVSVDRQKIEEWLEGLDHTPDEIAAEDLADYHWEVGSVDARLHAGETVFMSDFERELYDRIAVAAGLVVVPQWPSRGKSIDLVVTDPDGRRLAVEADGEQHHEMDGGSLIPEDIERQGLLEEAGWVFHRIRHTAFKANPDSEVERLMEQLREQPPNADLAARMRGEALVAEAIDEAALVSAHLRAGAGRAENLDAGPEAADGLHSRPNLTQRASEYGFEPAATAPGQAADSVDEERSASESPRAASEMEEDTAALAEPSADVSEMTGTQLDNLVDEIFAEVDEVDDPPALDDDDAEEHEEPEKVSTRQLSANAIGNLADVELRTLAACVAELVSVRGSLEDKELADAFSDYFKIDVPRNLRSLLTKFAWSAGGHHFVELTPDKTTWLPGEVERHEIEPFGEWTFNKVIARAADLLSIKPEKDAFDQLLHEVYKTERERVPRIVTTVAGKAIWAAQHR